MIRHPEEFLDVMREIASDGEYRKIKESIEKSRETGGKEDLTMYDIFADACDEAETKGIEKGSCAVVELCQEMGLTMDEVRQKIEKKFEMSVQAAGDAVVRYWNNGQQVRRDSESTD